MSNANDSGERELGKDRSTTKMKMAKGVAAVFMAIIAWECDMHPAVVVVLGLAAAYIFWKVGLAVLRQLLPLPPSNRTSVERHGVRSKAKVPDDETPPSRYPDSNLDLKVYGCLLNLAGAHGFVAPFLFAAMWCFFYNPAKIVVLGLGVNLIGQKALLGLLLMKVPLSHAAEGKRAWHMNLELISDLIAGLNSSHFKFAAAESVFVLFVIASSCLFFSHPTATVVLKVSIYVIGKTAAVGLLLKKVLNSDPPQASWQPIIDMTRVKYVSAHLLIAGVLVCMMAMPWYFSSGGVGPLCCCALVWTGVAVLLVQENTSSPVVA